MRKPRNIARYLFGLTLILAALTTVTILPLDPVVLAQPQVTTQSWTFTGNLNTARSGHTATLLPNGKVLVVGGATAGGFLASAELYNPATGTWSITGSLNVPRYLFTATLLPSGKVLVAGGDTTDTSVTNTAELYDPTTGAWSLTGNLNSTRSWHSATLLRNGKILIVGGWDGSSILNTAELYEPETGEWSVTGSLNTSRGRFSHTATLLQNGKVLVAGGSDDEDFGSSLTSTELYDPNAGAWSVTGSLNTGRMIHTATILPNGNVLAAGGEGFPCSGGFCYSTVNNTAELYNPATGTWSYTGSLSRRSSHTATVLPNGQILVAGGADFAYDNIGHGTFLNSAELYDLTTGTWGPTANLNAARYFHTATLLSNGKVLVVGGFDNSNGSLRSAELYDPGASSFANLIDDAQFFVRQQYLDFLGREPDADGLAYWTNQITQCGEDALCIHDRRIGVSAAFFVEQEFQQTGYVVYRAYRAAYGTMPNAPTRANVTFAQFMTDRAQLVGGPGLQQSTIDFANNFVSRPEFKQVYADDMSSPDFVVKLFGTADLIGSTQQMQDEMDSLTSSRKTRAQVLLDVIEMPEFKDREYNSAFVLMQYFGYLRRDPDQAGYDFWVNVLNNREPNNFSGMVCSFITSTEYQLRFGQAITRSNADCGQ